MEHAKSGVEMLVSDAAVNKTFREVLQSFRGKRVFLTGHTGFKGSWLSLLLSEAGATVKGYALAPDHENSLYQNLEPHLRIESVIADIRDAGRLLAEVKSFRPEFLFHLAAQPLVRYSYDHPIETFEVNVMGTANLLEAVRSLDYKCTTVVVTTDKVYENNESGIPFKENDPLGGHDPYSSSKAAAELVVQSYARSFFGQRFAVGGAAPSEAEEYPVSGQQSAVGGAALSEAEGYPVSGQQSAVGGQGSAVGGAALSEAEGYSVSGQQSAVGGQGSADGGAALSEAGGYPVSGQQSAVGGQGSAVGGTALSEAEGYPVSGQQSAVGGQGSADGGAALSEAEGLAAAGDLNKGIATARAGNVIGGGDRSADRIIPDLVRALETGNTLQVRNPSAIRPWQHVLDPLSGYLKLAMLLHIDPHKYSGSYNFGPYPDDQLTVKEIVETAIKSWGNGTYASPPITQQPHEAGNLRLDITKAMTQLQWKPKWNAKEAVERTVEWYTQISCHAESEIELCLENINAFNN